MKHHGKTNKISFVHEGHKIKLAPLSRKEASEDQVKLGKKIEDERKESKEKETKDREMIEKKIEQKIKKNKNILLFHSNPLFLCGDSLLKGFQKELPCEEFKISNFDPLFDDEISHVKGIEDEVAMGKSN